MKKLKTFILSIALICMVSITFAACGGGGGGSTDVGTTYVWKMGTMDAMDMMVEEGDRYSIKFSTGDNICELITVGEYPEIIEGTYIRTDDAIAITYYEEDYDDFVTMNGIIDDSTGILIITQTMDSVTAIVTFEYDEENEDYYAISAIIDIDFRWAITLKDNGTGSSTLIFDMMGMEESFSIIYVTEDDIVKIYDAEETEGDPMILQIVDGDLVLDLGLNLDEESELLGLAEFLYMMFGEEIVFVKQA